MSALPAQADFETAKASAAAPPLLPPAPGDWLRAPLWANRALFGQAALAAILINVFAVATALFSMAVYNKVIPNNAVDSMLALVIGITLVIVFDFTLRTLRGTFIDTAGQNIDRVLGAALFDRLLGMKLSDRRDSTGAFAGLLREFEALREFFASATITALVDVPFALFFIAAIGLIAPPLVIVPLLAIPIVIAVAVAAQPLLGRLSAAGMTQSLGKQGVIVETIGSLETVKTSLAGPLLARRWRTAVAHHAALSRRQRSVAAVAVNVAAAMQSIVLVATLALGVTLIARHQLSMGALVAASMLASRAVAPLGQIAGLLTRLSHTRDAYRALDRVMTRPGEVGGAAGRRGQDMQPLRRPVMTGRLAFRRVSFRYPGSTQLALEDVSFDIAPGDRVAIIGPVGSGKSTIARLLLGLYQPEDGAVIIDDADVRQIHPDDLRANIGAVLQDVVLLSGSIRDNIALAHPAIDDTEVLRAARLSGAHDFIGKLPGGYDVQLADRGEGLSGGQRQAIAIARALARPAGAGAKPVLIFDEMTSALDRLSETALIGRLEAEIGASTMVFVSHREAILRLATHVIVMDGGRIAMQGPRDAVMQMLA